jgi:hypothetical protein
MSSSTRFVASRVRRGEWLAGAASLALLGVMFAGWFRFPVELAGGRAALQAQDAWSALTVIDVLLAVGAVSGLALLYAQAARTSPALPVSLSVSTTVLGGLGTIALAIRIALPPGNSTVMVGAYIGLACAAVTAIGGWRSLRTEGSPAPYPLAQIETISLPDASHRPWDLSHTRSTLEGTGSD